MCHGAYEMRLLILSSLIFLMSCTSIHTNRQEYGTYTPSSSTNYRGELLYDAALTFSEEGAIKKMEQLCIPYGGLDLTSIIHGEIKYDAFTRYTYICNKQKEIVPDTTPITTSAPTPTTTPTSRVSIDDAKIQCEDIGFKAGTEKFGECVLRLNR